MNTIYCGSVRVPFKDIQPGNAHTQMEFSDEFFAGVLRVITIDTR